MTIIPKVGLVVKYDFLWKHEAATGQEHGSKDRPSAIIIVSDENEDGSRKVVLCAITHTPPFQNEKAVAVPAKVSDHLGFDGLKSWIKTDQVNTVIWNKGQIPYGITPVGKNQWAYGEIPQKLGKLVWDQLKDNIRQSKLANVNRDAE